MTGSVEREEQRLPDGRRRIFYRLMTQESHAKPDVTVITGATALARAVCDRVAGTGRLAVMVDRSGQGAPSARAVYQGRCGCPEIWAAISHQFRVREVIHTAALDAAGAVDPFVSFSDVVTDGVEMAAILRGLSPASCIMASDGAISSAADSPEPIADSPLTCLATPYQENLRQLERQVRMIAETGGCAWTILRVFPILDCAAGEIRDLWGRTIWPARGAAVLENVLLVEDAAEALVTAVEYTSLGVRGFQADLASGLSLHLLDLPEEGWRLQEKPPAVPTTLADGWNWRVDRARMAARLAQVKNAACGRTLS